uniref:Uncharacterized protein n=1 Tax=Oryza punctata TaxID=4537 RepID=A0A0E0KFH4_ORYPU
MVSPPPSPPLNPRKTPGPSQPPPPGRASSPVAGRRAGRLRQHGREAWSPRQPARAALLQGGRLDDGARWLRPRGIEHAAPRQPIRQESGQRLVSFRLAALNDLRPRRAKPAMERPGWISRWSWRPRGQR